MVTPLHMYIGVLWGTSMGSVCFYCYDRDSYWWLGAFLVVSAVVVAAYIALVLRARRRTPADGSPAASTGTSASDVDAGERSSAVAASSAQHPRETDSDETEADEDTAEDADKGAEVRCLDSRRGDCGQSGRWPHERP